jgi:hypothetical protein
MSMRDAKDLHSDITKLLITLEQLHNKSAPQKEEVITIELTGGGFKST